jgi:hypothetical protein
MSFAPTNLHNYHTDIAKAEERKQSGINNALRNHAASIERALADWRENQGEPLDLKALSGALDAAIQSAMQEYRDEFRRIGEQHGV